MNARRTKHYPEIAPSILRFRNPVKNQLPMLTNGSDDRREELRHIKRLLKDRQTRCVTITGSNDNVKSDVAVQAASEMKTAYADGVRHVSLAEAQEDASALFDLVSTLMPVQDHYFTGKDTVPLVQALTECLISKTLLIVIEYAGGFDIIKQFVEQTVAQSDNVRFLLTAEVPLQISEERTIDLIGVIDGAVEIEILYNHLSDDDQVVFAKLGVFSGGFTIDAARSVCHEADITKTLTRLHAEGLIYVDADAHDLRYRLLPSEREFALSQWAAQDRFDVDQLHNRHAQYYLKLAETLDARLRDPQGRAPHPTPEKVCRQMDMELPNFRAAITRGQAQNNSRIVGSFGAACAHYFLTRGLWFEGIYRARQAIAHIRQDEDKRHLPRILNWLCCIYLHQGWYDMTEQAGLDCMEAGYAVHDLSNVASALLMRATLRRQDDNDKEAHPLYLESLYVSRKAGSKFDIVVALNNLAFNSYTPDEEAETYFIEAMEIHRSSGSTGSLLIPMSGLAGIVERRGDWTRAYQIRREQLQIARNWGGLHDIRSLIQALSAVSIKLRHFDNAVLQLQAARCLCNMSDADTPPDKNRGSKIKKMLDEIKNQEAIDTFTASLPDLRRMSTVAIADLVLKAA